ncbi:MAG: Mrp/NBP35 family ATP-binding protein [Fimbriimonadaceae bacterium]
MALTEAMVLEALRVVEDPDLHKDIVSLGFVKDVVIDGAKVSFTVQLTTPACPVKDILEAEARAAVAGIPGVTEVDLTMTAQVRERPNPADTLPNVRQIIAIASGKGGVGKSTVTVNLAVALAEQGARVGLMDADVYGPSIPMMTGTDGQYPLTQDSKIIPIERFGIKMMSLGYLLQDGQAPMWRGPMVAGTVKQLLSDVKWGHLDYLLVDLPPGTGDAPMTLAQQVPLTGVVIVTTPHNVAANIAGSCAALFRRLNTPVLGVVENMGAMVLPNGETMRVFAGKSGDELAGELGVPYLGAVPLDPEVSYSSDAGEPIMKARPDEAAAKAFRFIAGEVARQASVVAISRDPHLASSEDQTGLKFEPSPS